MTTRSQTNFYLRPEVIARAARQLRAAEGSLALAQRELADALRVSEGEIGSALREFEASQRDARRAGRVAAASRAERAPWIRGALAATAVGHALARIRDWIPAQRALEEGLRVGREAHPVPLPAAVRTALLERLERVEAHERRDLAEVVSCSVEAT